MLKWAKKKKYFEEKFDRCSGDSKYTWKLLNELTFRKRNKNGSPSEIEINGKTTQDSTQIAEAFFSYFSSVGRNLESQIPHINN